MMWGCARGCAEAQCATTVLAPFGSCVRLNVSGSSAVRRVRRVITDYTLGVKAFAGPSCNDYISDFGTTTLKSGTCVKSPFEKYIMVYYIDPRDSPASARVTWRARCQPGCMECADGWYENSAIDLCTAFGTLHCTPLPSPCPFPLPLHRLLTSLSLSLVNTHCAQATTTWRSA